MLENYTLYSSAGEPIRDVKVDFFRPRMEVLVLRNRHRALDNRYFLWREDKQQYQEVIGYVLWSVQNE